MLTENHLDKKQQQKCMFKKEEEEKNNNFFGTDNEMEEMEKHFFGTNDEIEEHFKYIKDFFLGINFKFEEDEKTKGKIKKRIIGQVQIID